MSEKEYIILLPSTFKNREVHGKTAKIYIDDTHIVKHGQVIFMEDNLPVKMPEPKFEFKTTPLGGWTMPKQPQCTGKIQTW